MEEFKYTPLNLEKPAIRLLCLHPGSDNMIIACELFQAELHQRDSMVSYEALSYTWGFPHLSKTIHVNGCCLRITDNLYRALLELRYQHRQRVLWIDAVCIDQRNDKERGHQVGQMGNIYKEADSVIFRLGLGSDTRDLFMESLQRLQKKSIQHACRAWLRQDSRWEDLWTCSFGPVLELHEADLWELRQGLKEILEQPWFRRVWILQEVAFAKAGIISCGTKSVPARLFFLAPLLLGITPDAHCQSVLDIVPSPWRESTWWRESRSFYNLLLNFGKSEATDSRDLVYALRGISSDLADKCDDPLFPDYKKSQEELVHDVIQYFYDFDAAYILEEAPRLSSIRELANNLPRLETNVCRYLATMSRPDHMERILKRSEILVTKDMIKAAAQYDKEGKVVSVLLRYRGGEFKIDHEVLLCAAENLNAAKEVFEVFWCHQKQLIITEQILITTAENPKSGHSAIRFLLSLKTQDYRIAPMLEAVARNTSDSSRREIVRMLLQQNDYKNDTITEVLTAAAKIQDCDLQTEIIVPLQQQKGSSDNMISEVITTTANIQDFNLQRKIIKILLEQKSNSIWNISEVITAAAKIRDHNLQAVIIRILFEQESNSYWMISEVIAAADEIRDHNLQTEIIRILLKKKGNSDEIISELLTAASATERKSCHFGEAIIKALLEQKDIRNDAISEVLTVAAGIQGISHSILENFVRENPRFKISRDVVTVAMRNWSGDTDNFEVLCRYFPSLN